MSSLTVFAPAKLNLFLAITGRRPDGFHDLLSVVTPLTFGDELVIERTETPSYSLTCDDPEVPRDETNLVLRAARLFAAAVSLPYGARFHLRKRIPMGAGLGGGSSDAAAALRGLNRQNGELLSETELAELAAQGGSDCVLFLHPRGSVMRGRGESIQALPSAGLNRVVGRRVLVFKPPFGINTAWAYRQMAETAPGSYLPSLQAEARLERWLSDASLPAEELLFNNMEPAAFSKYLGLPTLLQELRDRFGLKPGMSGSGSACFAFLRDSDDVEEITAFIQAAWGRESFIIEAQTG